MHPTLDDFQNCPDDLFVQVAHWDQCADQDWNAILSDDELGRRNSFTHQGRKNGFTLGRIALRRLLASHQGIKERDVLIESAPSGQLFCPDSGYHISLAHSGNSAVAVLGKRHVGVDVEEIRTKPDELLEYILSEEEKSHIRSLDVPESHRLFICWTLKESVLKGLGVGLRSSPRKVRLQIEPSSRSAIITDPNGDIWQGRYCISGTWVSAIAYREDQ